MENNLKAEEGYALISMALDCRAKSEINKMLDCSYKALEIFELIQKPFGQIKSLNLMGIAYFYNSMYEEAFKSLMQAMNLLDVFIDYYLLSCVLGNIGEVHRESGNYDKALECYYSSLKICVENNFKRNTASLYSNIGEVNFSKNKFDVALEYYTKSYEILVKERDMVNLGEIENKLGEVYYINENYCKAEEWFDSALSRLESVNNKFYAIDVLVNIARLQFGKNIEKSNKYFEKAIQYAEKINARKKLSEVYRIVSEHYEILGDYKVSLKYFKKHFHVNEELRTLNIGNKLELLNIQVEHIEEKEKFDKMKKLLKFEIENQKNELENIRRTNKNLEKKAYEDELTSIPNRRYINCYLNKKWEKHLSFHETIAFFIIDIDNFKKYNDYWGHAQGDECLKEVVNCIKKIQTKRKDFIGRYGGEEFVYYAESINYDQALELGNLIGREVKKLNLEYMDGNKKSVVTISLGGALGKLSDFVNIINMIETADKELYKAKNNGRNRTNLKSISKKIHMDEKRIMVLKQ